MFFTINSVRLLRHLKLIVKCECHLEDIKQTERKTLKRH